MAVFINGGFTGLTYPMNTPRIGWRRVTGTITASTSAAGYAAANAATDRTDSFWRPTSVAATWAIDAGSAVPVSYCAIAAHNLFTMGCTFQVQFSTDGVTYASVTTRTPTDDGAVMCLFAEQTYRYMRLRISAGSVPTIGHIRFGRITEFPLPCIYAGMSFERARQVTYDLNRSEGGQFVGRSKKSVSLAPVIEVPDLPVSWIESEYDAFALAAETESFFIADRPSVFPKSVAYCLTGASVQSERTRPLTAAAHTVRIEAAGFLA